MFGLCLDISIQLCPVCGCLSTGGEASGFGQAGDT